MNKKYKVKSYQLKDHPKELAALDKESRGVIAITLLMVPPIKVTFVHSILADYWNIVYSIGSKEKINSLSPITTPYIEKCVANKILIPVHSTEKEWKVQVALGIACAWGREYRLKSHIGV